MLPHLRDFALDVGKPKSDSQQDDSKHSPRNGPAARDDDERHTGEEYEDSEDASNISPGMIHRSRGREVASVYVS